MTNLAWTPEQDQQIRDHVAEGLSFGAIALLMGRSRNSIVGRAHRVGIKPAEKKKVRTVVELITEKISQPKKKISPEKNNQISDEITDAINAVTLIDLEPHHCRWAVGADEDGLALFCAETADKPPYCTEHRALAYYPSRYQQR